MASLLIFVLLLPLLGAGAIALLSPARRDWAGRIAAAVTAIALLLMLAVALPFVPTGGWQNLVQADWLPELGIGFSLGLDGIGLQFALLSCLLGCAATFSAWRAGLESRSLYAMLLVLQAGAALAFASRDLFVFVAGWQVALIATTVLLARYGKGEASTRFRLFTGVGFALSLAALLVLYLLNGSASDVMLLQQNHPAAVAPMEMQLLIFGVLALGFALQVPLVPWHPWLPETLENLPAPAAALVLALVAPIGTFGLIRFGFAVMPGPAQYLSPVLVFIGLVSVLYGGWGAMIASGRRRAAFVAIAASGATLAGLGAFQMVLMHAALVILAIASMLLPVWVLVADASGRLQGARLTMVRGGAVLLVILWPLATWGLLAGFATSLVALLGL